MQSSTSDDSGTSEPGKQLVENLIDHGDFAEARIHANSLLTNCPADPEIYALLASIEVNAGRLSVARRYMLEALRLAPDSAVARENLAFLDNLEQQATNADFIRTWLVWRTRNLDIPRIISLETVGRCNAKCGFCPHPMLDRKFEAMSDELFNKIIGEASRFPSDRFSGFGMHSVNEPFMDRKIFDRLMAINRFVPNAQIGITTNMNVMPPRFFERIRKVRQISEWIVSFNAANRSEYEETMHIDYRRTVSNIGRLLEENRASRFVPGPIRLSRVESGDERDRQFANQCAEVFSGFVRGVDFEPVTMGRTNWLGDVAETSPGYFHAYPCHQWVNLTVHCNGVVPHCCVDARAQFPFGDANKQSILEIYNNPYWKNLRESVSAREVVYPCKTCNLR